jgi:hypothetical protein
MYLLFAIAGLLAVIASRSIPASTGIQTLILVIVHGIAGLTIFLLPVFMAAEEQVQPAFALVGLGGALIGSGGLLLSLQRAGRPLLSKELILRLFPALLFLMTACFVAGFKLG